MSTPRDLARWLVELESLPAELAAAAARLDPAAQRRPPAGGGFSLVEQAWHLADLEAEGYGLRIGRLLAEDDPLLPDFDGARVAAERGYRSRSLDDGIAAFASARSANLGRLRSVAPEQWARKGRQEGVGAVALEDLPRMMLEHDASHRAEIGALVAELQG